MHCTACKSEEDTSKIVKKYSVPFKCPDCGSIDFPIQAMNGIVFVWMPKQPVKVGAIIVPERLNQPFTSAFGVVLSHGKGCEDLKTKKFVPCELVVGDRVWRDKDTPWKMSMDAPDGNTYSICYMNILDIWVKEDQFDEDEEFVQQL